MSKPSSTELEAGKLLIAAAHMADFNFSHSVVLLCEHQDQGSFGLVLNQSSNLRICQVLEDIDWDCPVMRGGPVEEGTLHFLHTRADLDLGSREVIPGVFWGGDFERLRSLMQENLIRPDECRFFLGYSGWGAGQLREEVQTNSWYLRPATPELVFHVDFRNHWRDTLRTMGPDFQVLSNFPDDPRFN